MKPSTRFVYPLLAQSGEESIPVDADLTYIPGIRDYRVRGQEHSCIVHAATATDDFGARRSADLLAAAQVAADLALDEIRAEAIARLQIQRENQEVKDALRNRPINQPLINMPEGLTMPSGLPATVGEFRLMRELAELG